jgi:prefoldin subunit 5|tara:strand:+ start:2282 stop:2491 length:210 start_codon:yes stop_codon:yes gene_type:complete
MKDKIKDKLNILVESKTVTQYDIDEALKFLYDDKKQLMKERASINNKLKKLNEQIVYWENMLPNQTSLF